MTGGAGRGARRPGRPSARLLAGLGLVVAVRTLALADLEAVLTGTYTASSQKGTLTLFLAVDDAGRLVGLLRGDSGGQMRLDGRANGPSAEGTTNDGRSRGVFAVHLEGSRLGMAMAEMGRDGQIDPSRALRERYFYLCSNGSFVSSGQSSVAVYVPGATGGSARRSEDAGTWRVVPEGDLVRLELQSRDGGAARDLLSRVDGKTFLNRTRTFVTPENNRCP